MAKRPSDHRPSDNAHGQRPAGTGTARYDEEPGDRELLEFEGAATHQAVIKVVGVGGGGGNALNNMVVSGLQGVEFIAANTDAQALRHNLAGIKLQLGNEVTRGLGCGADPDKGRSSALEVRERLREHFTGTDMVFVTAGLGGGTGTGAAPVVAEVAREAGALTVGVVTKPFHFEGRVRLRHAERGLEELHRVVDTVITIPNQRLLALAGKNTSVKEAFKLADDVLYNAVRGISDLITIHGLINLDFADVRTIMNEMGVALMGTGIAQGDNRAEEAARTAISSPLLEDLSIDGAHGVLINITGGPDLSLFEVNEASSLIQQAAHEDANIIFGAVIDESMPEGEMRVTVIATGLVDERVRRGRDSGTVRDVSRSREPREERDNVTPLRPYADPAPMSASAEPRPPQQAPLLEPAPERSRPSPADFLSPFEDELDEPAFLRRGRRPEKDEEEEREQPAFLRRSAD
jgi:cell division protein FtsZ